LRGHASLCSFSNCARLHDKSPPIPGQACRYDADACWLSTHRFVFGGLAQRMSGIPMTRNGNSALLSTPVPPELRAVPPSPAPRGRWSGRGPTLGRGALLRGGCRLGVSGLRPVRGRLAGILLIPAGLIVQAVHAEPWRSRPPLRRPPYPTRRCNEA
jgi:hypothetical protein